MPIRRKLESRILCCEFDSAVGVKSLRPLLCGPRMFYGHVNGFLKRLSEKLFERERETEGEGWESSLVKRWSIHAQNPSARIKSLCNYKLYADFYTSRQWAFYGILWLHFDTVVNQIYFKFVLIYATNKFDVDMNVNTTINIVWNGVPTLWVFYRLNPQMS